MSVYIIIIVTGVAFVVVVCSITVVYLFIWKCIWIYCVGAKATGNSRSGSQKFPPLSVKIPENSRYENTPYTSLCRRKATKIVIFMPITD